VTIESKAARVFDQRAGFQPCVSYLMAWTGRSTAQPAVSEFSWGANGGKGRESLLGMAGRHRGAGSGGEATSHRPGRNPVLPARFTCERLESGFWSSRTHV